jgi:uncharacterized oxidoreductase
LPRLSGHFSSLVAKYADIDTVIVNAGIQSYFSPDKPDEQPSSEKVIQEVNTNLTGPILLGTLLINFFLSKPNLPPASILLVGSGLAFLPLPKFSIYCATKGAFHAYAVSLRAALRQTPIKVVEVRPPYVETELNKDFKDRMIADMGGPSNMPKAMALDAFLDEIMHGFQASKDKIGVGFGQIAFNAWRGAFGLFLERFHVRG